MKEWLQEWNNGQPKGKAHLYYLQDMEVFNTRTFKARYSIVNTECSLGLSIMDSLSLFVKTDDNHCKRCKAIELRRQQDNKK
jgi:7-cyano-7-deazaguanine synthase in queuosine biosynthesis